MLLSTAKCLRSAKQVPSHTVLRKPPACSRKFAVALAAMLALPASWVQASGALARLDLSRADIDAVAVDPEHTTVRLTPSAALLLRQMTRDNVGRTLELRIDGLTALSVRVQAEIESGILRLPRPSPELQQRLQTAVPSAPASKP